MTEPPSIAMMAERQRALLRQLVYERGPNVGVMVTDISMRVGSPESAQAMRLAQMGGLSIPAAGILTQGPDDPHPGERWFMWDKSKWDSQDSLR